MIVATDKVFLQNAASLPEKTLYIAPTAGEGATCRTCAHCPWMAMNGLKAITDAWKGIRKTIKFMSVRYYEKSITTIK